MTGFLTERGFKADWPHGTRARYVAAKCRCEPCTIANRDYARERGRRIARGQGNPLVSTAPARKHVRRLQRMGIGYRAVAAAAGVRPDLLQQIRRGKLQMHKELADAILGVTVAKARRGAQMIPADRTREQVAQLLARGFTKQELARRVKPTRRPGLVPHLQVLRGTRVLVSTARAIAALAGEAPPPRKRGGWPAVCRCARPLPLRDTCAKCERPLMAGRSVVASGA